MAVQAFLFWSANILLFYELKAVQIEKMHYYTRKR